MRKLLLCLAVLIVVTGANSQVISSRQIDSLTNMVLKTFDVPGIAVAVVKDGKVVHAKGYGVRSMRTGKKVDVLIWERDDARRWFNENASGIVLPKLHIIQYGSSPTLH